jgi:hypothetical protein
MLDGRGVKYKHNKTDHEFLLHHKGRKGVIWIASGDDPDSLKGPNIGSANIDEPFIQKREVFDQVMARVRDPGAVFREITMTGTPEELNWGYEICEGEEAGNFDLEVVHASTRDNLALPQQYIDSLLSGYDSETVQAYVDGKFVIRSKDGVYNQYSADNETDRVFKPGPIHWAHDFNFLPMSSAIIQVEGDNIFVVDEIVLDHAEAIDTAKEFVERYENYKKCPVILYGDASGRVGEKHGKVSNYVEIERHLRQNGFTVSRKVPLANPSIKDGQNSLRGKIKNAKDEITFFVNKAACPTVDKGLKTVKYKKGSTFQEDETNRAQHVTYRTRYIKGQIMPHENFESHLKALDSEETCSAQKAVDYLHGGYLPWIERLLNDKKRGIKDWDSRGVQILWENFLGTVIERSAKTYNNQPERKVVVNGENDEGATDTYNQLLFNSNFRVSTEELDGLARLLKTAILLPQWVEETGEFLFTVLSRNNSHVEWDAKTGLITSIMYVSPLCSPNGNKMFHLWNVDRVIDIEITSDSSAGGRAYRILSTAPHSYGVVPAVPLYDIRKPPWSVWSKPVWEQLTYVTDSINMFHIEMKFNQRFQSFGTLFTNAQIPDGFVVGPDSVVELKLNPGEQPFIEYKAPASISVAIKSFSDWLDNFREAIASEWGVNLSVAGAGSADSGFKLVVEEAPALETRAKRIASAEDFERNLYNVIQPMATFHGIALPEDGKVKADFDEPRLPVAKKEEFDMMMEKLNRQLITKRDFWKWENPDLTEKQLDEMEAATKTQNPAAPDFSES